MGESSALTQKIVVGLMILVVGAAGGYFLWSTKYKEAEATLVSAKGAQASAQTDVEAKRKQLQDLKNQPKASKEPTAKYLTSKTAIPQKQLVIEAKYQINEIGKKAGIQVTEIDGSSASAAAASSATGGAQGAQPMTFTITGSARYANVLMFMQRLHEEVEPIDGKVYVRGRLFNVLSWSFGTASGGEASGPDLGAAASSSGSSGSSSTQQVGSERTFSIVVELYSDGSGNATTGEPNGTEVAPGSAGATGAAGATGGTEAGAAGAAGANGTNGAAPGAVVPNGTGTSQPSTGTTTPGGTGGTGTNTGSSTTSSGSTPASAAGATGSTTSPGGGQS